jgi:hypothetical protein
MLHIVYGIFFVNQQLQTCRRGEIVRLHDTNHTEFLLNKFFTKTIIIKITGPDMLD